MKRIAQALAGTALGLFGVIGTAAAQVPGYTLPGAVLLAGPGGDYPFIAQPPPGQQAEIFGCQGGYGWCDVGVDGARGWMPGNTLQVEYGNQWVGLPYYAPRIGLPIIGFDLGSYWGQYYRGRPFFGQRDAWFGYGRPGWSRPGGWGAPGYGGPGGWGSGYHGPGYHGPGWGGPGWGGPGHGGFPPPHPVPGGPDHGLPPPDHGFQDHGSQGFQDHSDSHGSQDRGGQDHAAHDTGQDHPAGPRPDQAHLPAPPTGGQAPQDHHTKGPPGQPPQ